MSNKNRQLMCRCLYYSLCAQLRLPPMVILAVLNKQANGAMFEREFKVGKIQLYE